MNRWTPKDRLAVTFDNVFFADVYTGCFDRAVTALLSADRSDKSRAKFLAEARFWLDRIARRHAGSKCDAIAEQPATLDLQDFYRIGLLAMQCKYLAMLIKPNAAAPVRQCGTVTVGSVIEVIAAIDAEIGLGEE